MWYNVSALLTKYTSCASVVLQDTEWGLGVFFFTSCVVVEKKIRITSKCAFQDLSRQIDFRTGVFFSLSYAKLIFHTHLSSRSKLDLV